MYTSIIIGLGRIGFEYDWSEAIEENKGLTGSRVLTHARALECHPDFQLVAGVDPSGEKRDKFSRRYKTKCYKSLSELIDSGLKKVDLAVVATDPSSFVEVTREILSNIQVRCILLEKPVGMNKKDANELYDLSSYYPKTQFAVNYIRRYLKSADGVRKDIQEFKYGSLITGRVLYGKGLFRNGSHYVNLLESWIGQLEVTAVVRDTKCSIYGDRERDIIARAVDQSNQPIYIISGDPARVHYGEIDLVFEKARVYWEGAEQRLKIWKIGGKADREGYSRLELAVDRDIEELSVYQYKVVEKLASFLGGNGDNCIGCNLRDAVKTVETLDTDCLDKEVSRLVDSLKMM